jgi:predicted phage tail protein
VKTVYLHGQLGKRFGKKWKLAAQTPGEVIQALDANSDGFLEYICKKSQQGEDYILLKKSPNEIRNKQEVYENAITVDSINLLDSGCEIHILSKAYGGVVASAIAFGAAGTAFAVGGIGNMILAGMIWGVIGQVAMNALFKPPKPPARGTPTSTKSFLISGAQTRQAQGIAVPLGYGRLKIGSANVATRKINKKINSTKNASVLESYTEMEFIDLLCEGPIEGFVNKFGGAISGGDIKEGIFLNDVQVKSTETGELNYILNENEDPELSEPQFKDGSFEGNTILSDEIFAIKSYDVLLYGAGPYNASNQPQSTYNNVSQAKNAGSKIVSHLVSNENVSEVIFGLSAELSIGNDDGSTSPNSVKFAILVTRGSREYNVLDPDSECTVTFESNAGLSINKNRYNSTFTLSGICSSPYPFDIHIKYDPKLNSSELSGGLTFKIIKLSAEYDQSVKGGSVGGIARRRNLNFAHVVENIKEKMLYPHSAMCKMLVDGKNFSNVPDRNYHLKLKRILVPSNYNPESRTYNGPWDGLFKGQTDASQSINEISDTRKVWSDNPAWVFFDMLHNPRYGLGKYGLEEANIDKWQLYKVAKYCDEMVETDFPIETATGKPRAFNTSGIPFSGYFDINIEGISQADFNSEFTGMNGKKIALFIYQHNYGNGSLSSSKQDDVKQKSIDRLGEMVIEERIIISADSASKSVRISGPNLANNPAAFGTNNTVLGACCTQINHPVVEPRFTANLLLTDRSEAMQIINSMASIFRGMATYIGGKISVTNDRFKNPIQLFNNSNIVNSEFEYSGVQKDKKITASMIRFNNKDKNFKPDIIYEEDASSMQSLGYVENETMGFGITSEGQARRLAKWTLLTSQLETESIKFVTGQEASYLLPGSVFEVSDETRTNKDKSGRVLDVQLYRNRTITDENEIEQTVNIYDPYILLDKDNLSTPTHSRVELTVYSAQANETLDDIDRRSVFEKSEDDQESEIDSLRTPQLVRFEGSLYSDPSIDSYGPKGQKTIATDLSLKIPIDISLPDNLIKIYEHGFNDGDRIYFVTDGVLPGGIKVANNNLPNYYIINSTKHTFQVSESSGGSAVNIFSNGKDRFNNQGGLHYAVTIDSNKINAALDQINLGAVYSIKGLVGTRADTEIDAVVREKLGVIKTYSNGWSKSNFFGMIKIFYEWIYVAGLGWVFVKNLIESQDQDYWFFVQDIGWIWTNNENKNKFWRIDNKAYDSSNNWLYVLYNNSSFDKIVGFFAYDSSATSGNPNRLSNGSKYTLGKSKKISIRKISSVNPVGYFLSNEKNFSYAIAPENQSSSLSVSGNPNLIERNVSTIYAVDGESSIQGEPAIRIEVEEGHGVDFNKNNVLEIFGSNTSADGSWHIVAVDDNVLELVGSSSIASGFNQVNNIGTIFLTEALSSLVDRFLEGQLFRTISVKEISENKYEVQGLEYNYSKFFAVDSKGVVRAPVLPIPPQADMSIPEAPDGLVLFDLTV